MAEAMKIGGGQLARHPETERRWLAGLSPGPLAVEISPTGGCNHNCFHCGFQQIEPYAQRKTFLDFTAYKQFMDDFAELGGAEIFFAGNGEPVLNPNIGEMFAYGRTLGVSMVMSTNGVPLTPKRAEEILPHAGWIRFSVNGGNAEAYSRVHECDATDFDKLIRNLEACVAIRDRDNLPVRLVLQFIIYDYNYKSARQMVDLHHRLGTDQLVFRSVAEENRNSSTAKDEILAVLKDIDGADKVLVRWDSFEQTAKPSWTKCYGVNFRICLDHKGNLITCNRHFFKNSIFGNIHEARFKDIWHSEQRRALFTAIEPGDDIPVCGKWCQMAADNIYAEQVIAEIS